MKQVNIKLCLRAWEKTKRIAAARVQLVYITMAHIFTKFCVSNETDLKNKLTADYTKPIIYVVKMDLIK